MPVGEGDPTVQLSEVRGKLYGGKKRRRRAIGFASTALLGAVGFVACTGPDKGNGGPTNAVPSISTPGESTNPFMTPSPPLSPSLSPSPSPSISQEPAGSQFLSLCNTQFGTQEGTFSGGLSTFPATVSRPSVFVVSPERSTQQAITVRSADNPQGPWNTVTKNRTTGMVGLVSEDTVFDTTQGKAAWGKTCLASPEEARKEINSRVDDLCRRREFGLSEVVVFNIGADGKPTQQRVVKC